MAYEEKMSQTKAHTLILEGRGKLSVSGVEDVESFDENEIITRTGKGDLIIRGSGLHIEKLGLDTGELSVTGTVTEMCYDESAPQGSFWSRLFK